MNHTMNAPDLLRSAAVLIERALIQLDVSHDVCPTCTSVRYTNIEAKRVYDRFTDTPHKLVESAEALDDPAAAADKRRLGHEIERNIKRATRSTFKLPGARR